MDRDATRPAGTVPGHDLHRVAGPPFVIVARPARRAKLAGRGLHREGPRVRSRKFVAHGSCRGRGRDRSADGRARRRILLHRPLRTRPLEKHHARRQGRAFEGLGPVAFSHLVHRAHPHPVFRGLGKIRDCRPRRRPVVVPFRECAGPGGAVLHVIVHDVERPARRRFPGHRQTVVRDVRQRRQRRRFRRCAPPTRSQQPIDQVPFGRVRRFPFFFRRSGLSRGNTGHNDRQETAQEKRCEYPIHSVLVRRGVRSAGPPRPAYAVRPKIQPHLLGHHPTRFITCSDAAPAPSNSSYSADG